MPFHSTRTAATLAALATLCACGGDDDAGRPGPDLDAATAVPLDAGVPDGLMPVTLRFKATVGAEDLVCGQGYLGQGSTKVPAKVQDFRFFVQDVRLVASDGSEVPMVLDERAPHQSRDVVLIDFTDGRDSCTTGDATANTVITGRVPPGTYRGLSFAIGVPEGLNHGDPAVLPAPLTAIGASWGWVQGHRFFIAEMRHAPELTSFDGGAAVDAGAATDAGSGSSGGGGHNASAAQPGLAIAHIGSTGCVGGAGGVGIRCDHPNRGAVKLTGFDPTVGSVVADLGAVFAGTDLLRGLLCHGRGESCTPPMIAAGIDVASGLPLPTQQVFRVE
jgi:uncharacterized repeat protein (TIGR04052 family)